MERSVRWLAIAVGGLAVAVVFVGLAIVATGRPPATPVLTAQPSNVVQTPIASCMDSLTTRLYQVQQQSMRTTLEEGDVVLLRLRAVGEAFRRGQIVVFSTGVGEEAAPLIKRVIGQPGDLVELRAGLVYVNGMRLDEPYVHGAATDPLGDGESWTVPPDQVFLMGDNRGNSTDSRAFGPVTLGSVVGAAVLRCLPLDRAGPIE